MLTNTWTQLGVSAPTRFGGGHSGGNVAVVRDYRTAVLLCPITAGTEATTEARSNAEQSREKRSDTHRQWNLWNGGQRSPGWR